MSRTAWRKRRANLAKRRPACPMCDKAAHAELEARAKRIYAGELAAIAEHSNIELLDWQIDVMWRTLGEASRARYLAEAGRGA